jgi:hypothetical protein
LNGGCSLDQGGARDVAAGGDRCLDGGLVRLDFLPEKFQRQYIDRQYFDLLAASRQPGRLHFWRDRSREVDVLLERGGRFWLGDAKWSELPRPADAARLHQVAALLPANSVSALALLCRAPHRFPLGNGVDALPLQELGSVWGLVERDSCSP